MTLYKTIIRTDLGDLQEEDVKRALSFGPMRLIVHERMLEKVRALVPEIFVVTTGTTGGPHPFEIWAEVREGENGTIRPAFVAPAESPIAPREKKQHILVVDIKKLFNQGLNSEAIVKHYKVKGLEVDKYQIDNVKEGKSKRGYIRVKLLKKDKNVSTSSIVAPVENSTSIGTSKDVVRRQVAKPDKNKKKPKLQKVRKINTKRRNGNKSSTTRSVGAQNSQDVESSTSKRSRV